MFLYELLKNLHAESHRVLIFSMSKKILNVLETFLKSARFSGDEPIKYMRIDGDTEIC